MSTSLRELIANAERAGVSLRELRGGQSRMRGENMIKAIDAIQKRYPAYKPEKNVLTEEGADKFYKAVGK